VKALILGEHGDSMVPIWSSATVAGVSLLKHPKCTAAFQQKVFDRTKTSGAEAIKLKGGAGWAVGLTIAEVIHVMALDQPTLLPVSTQLTGEYGVKNTCTSLPTLLNRQGVMRREAIELWPREESAFVQSCKALDNTYSQVQK
jgi:L-lactate dehydrogenase